MRKFAACAIALAVLPALSASPPPPSPGAMQLFLWNASTGDLAAWTMDGTARVSSERLEPSPLTDFTWKVAGMADVNGDGHPDIVWQEQTRGDVGVWLMNGATRLWFEPLDPPQVADLGWKIVAVADVNGDAKPDLIWREERYGWLAAWLMDGTTRAAVVSLDPGTVDTCWEIVGTGDFNSDGQADLLWRNRDNGYVATWLMRGTARLDAVMLNPPQVDDLHWRIAATGDLNGDGQVDLVWQHETYGWLVAWLMSGTTRMGAVTLVPGTVDPAWRIQAGTRAAPDGGGVPVEGVLGSVVERIWGSAAAGSVVDVDPGTPWRSEGVALPSVVRSGGEWRMYFAGVENTADPYVSRVRIGLALSTDGESFTVANGNQPVLAEGAPGSFDSHSVSHPAVIQAGTNAAPEWWMYYAGADGTQGASGARVERVGLARSTDGVTWRREGAPVLDIGSDGEIDSTQAASPFVLRLGRTFHMWYGAYDGSHRIGYATSTDGVHWLKRGAARGLRGAAAGELGPSVYFDGHEYLMLYNSVDAAAQEWTLYAATSRDGQSWTAANSGLPLVGHAPPGTFAEAGPGRNSAVHLSELLLVNGELLAYYAGEDRESVVRIGLLRFTR